MLGASVPRAPGASGRVRAETGAPTEPLPLRFQRLEAPWQGRAGLGFLGGPGKAGTPFPLQGAQTALTWVLLVPLVPRGPRLCPPPRMFGGLPPASHRDRSRKQPPSVAPTGLGPELVSLVVPLIWLKPQPLPRRPRLPRRARSNAL